MKPLNAAGFETLRDSIMRSYDGVPEDERVDPLAARTVVKEPILDGTCIPNADAWRECRSPIDELSARLMPFTTGVGFVCAAALGL